MKIGQALKEERQKLGLTQEQMIRALLIRVIIQK